MRRVGRFVAGVLATSVALLLGAGAAQAFTFNLFETVNNTAAGEACDICSVLTLPALVQGGYVVLFENAAGSLADRSTWSDVVIFGEEVDDGILLATSGSTQHVQLLSKGCDSGVAGDFSCFPTIEQIISVPFATIIETAAPTVYVASPNTYNIWSEPSRVAEPGALLILGLGLAGLSAVAWRRRR